MSALAAVAAGSAGADVLMAQDFPEEHRFGYEGPFEAEIVPVVRRELVEAGEVSTSRESPSFAYQQGQRVVVQYTALCDIESTNPDSWLDIDIRVIGEVVRILPPTAGNSQHFCGAREGPQTKTVRAVIANLPTGHYRLEVIARINDPGEPPSSTIARLGRSTLIVSK